MRSKTYQVDYLCQWYLDPFLFFFAIFSPCTSAPPEQTMYEHRTILPERNPRRENKASAYIQSTKVSKRNLGRVGTYLSTTMVVQRTPTSSAGNKQPTRMNSALAKYLPKDQNKAETMKTCRTTGRDPSQAARLSAWRHNP